MRDLDPLQQELVANAAFVRGLAGALLRDPSTADDVAQDAHLAALSSPPDRPAGLRPWLVGVVRNLVRRRRRTEARRARREEVAARPEAQGPASSSAERAETIAALAQAVRRLEEPYRTAIVLRYLDGLPIAQVAQAMGTPLETARTRLRRALGSLRADLGAPATAERRLRALVPGAVAGPGMPRSPAFVKGGLAVATSTKWAAVTLVVAALGWLGVMWVTRTEGPGSQPVDTARAGPAAAELRSEQPLELTGATRPTSDATRPQATQAHDAAGAPAPRAAGAPAAEGQARGGIISGKVRLPEGASPSDWHVIWIWTRMPIGVARPGWCEVRDDGTFECSVPARDGQYVVALRKRAALWPAASAHREQSATPGQASDLVLEPDRTESFRVQLEGPLPSGEPLAVQVHSFARDGLTHVPNQHFVLADGRRELEIEGLELGTHTVVYVGPVKDGRYACWAGEPRAGETIPLSLAHGAVLGGQVDLSGGVDPTSVRVPLRGFNGIELETKVDAQGRWEQHGIDRGYLWSVGPIEGRDRTGARLVGKREVVSAGTTDIRSRLEKPSR